MKRFGVGLAVIVLLAGLLSGCSKGEVTGNPDTAGGKQTVIRMAVSGSEQEKQLRYETANLFMKEHPDIKIEWVDIGTERYQKTLTLISGGNAPDILYINEWTVPLAKRDVLMPLDDFINKDPDFNLDEFYPSVIDAYKVDGKLYGIPQEISPYVVFYNKDLFDKANLPYPKDNWTEEQFLETASKLTDPANKRYGYLYENFGAPLDGFLTRNNVELYADPPNTHLDSPEALETLTMLKKMVVDDHVSPSPSEQQAAGQGSDAQFRNQQVAMISSGMWYLPTFKKDPLPFKWDVVRMPAKQNQQTKVGALSWSISKSTKHPEAAWEVLKFFVGAEGMKIVAKYNMALPASSNAEANQLILDSGFPENVKAFVDSAPDVRMTEFMNGRYSEISDAVKEIVDRMMLGQLTPEQARQELIAKINEKSS
ncbi:sugar ABC transporter substrate-binding protein [Paenibacillus sp. Y412MC10]|uniref:ABC transporter substrate-binding protein n=1 Tax=Geobacillus sp. (strain Y412MC10) TaxID=481743 RepID=UPI001642CEAA|nr:sugar ABC transporter substrate-binding protein [Paenibacillus sp. Y412MC10]